MSNPVLVEVSRGGMVESIHRGAFCVSDAHGVEKLARGDIGTPVFPRSAIKAFQALPVIASGAADAFNFTEEEIALCCSSHGGEERHVQAAASMLSKANTHEEAYECGAHWPNYQRRTNQMIAAGEKPRQIHNNCSGKHAGMLALARHLSADTTGYVLPEHLVQREIAKTIATLCEVDIDNSARGIDGCSVPTWAIALRNVALGFAKFCTGEGLAPNQSAAAQRIITAVRNNPFMVAGSGRFCTDLMTALPRVFVKTGAEGVFCGCIPHAGLGFALKCEDGATRASEIATANMLLQIDVWNSEEAKILRGFTSRPLVNRRKIETGEISGSTEFASPV